MPPWDNSAMDGFAVQAADVTGATRRWPKTLRVVGESRAGHAPEAEMLAVSGCDFGLGEDLSAECRAHAEQALGFLLDYCTA
jgi:hypothetical protein